MDRPLLVFRVGYMETYDGEGDISGGGAYVEEHGTGGEMWNFRAEGGRCYGFVMTKSFAGIDLRRIDPSRTWSPNHELPGVDIIFIARRPEGGQVVVGWYRDATVFHKSYRGRRGRKKMGDWEGLNYLCEVDANQATLLPKDQRTFLVPQGVKGFPGQSNVWYPDNPSFEAQLRQLIGTRKQPAVAAKGRNTAPPDKDLITRIEKAAERATEHYFRKQGYTITFVQHDYKGWDLEARKDADHLLIEVKGHLGNVIQFELTPNEYDRLQEHHKRYRVCVLRNALDASAELEVYAPKKDGAEWMLRRIDKAGSIRFIEKVAARAFEEPTE